MRGPKMDEKLSDTHTGPLWEPRWEISRNGDQELAGKHGAHLLEACLRPETEAINQASCEFAGFMRGNHYLSIIDPARSVLGPGFGAILTELTTSCARLIVMRTGKNLDAYVIYFPCVHQRMSWIPDAGFRILDPGSWIQVPGSRILDTGSRLQDP